ncbi:hypothetical protein BV898_11442 [Hypsibius exemplaris]|nr:hypothetical protein BV898_11442 [Hypsibius exemplaris]
MNDCGGIRDCYYRKKGKPVPESRTKKWKQKFPKKVMCAAGVSYRGPTSIYFVPPTSKVDSAFFLNNIVKPIVEKDIPRLYPGEEHKVILHFDSASSHTTPAVYSYLKSKKVKYIGKEDWMANSPDLSPMDFGPNGIFKKSMFKKKPKGIPGLQRAARQVWKEFPLSVCRNVMKSWKGRVIQMVDAKGFQIENSKK